MPSQIECFCQNREKLSSCFGTSNSSYFLGHWCSKQVSYARQNWLKIKGKKDFLITTTIFELYSQKSKFCFDTKKLPLDSIWNYWIHESISILLTISSWQNSARIKLYSPISRTTWEKELSSYIQMLHSW